MAYSSSKKISALIVIFPPIILLVYAIVSYFIFFSYSNKNTDSVISYFNYEMKNSTKNIVESRVKTIDNYLKNSKVKTLEELSLMLKSLQITDDKTVAFLKGNKLLFSTTKVPEKIAKKLAKVEGFYEDDDLIAFSSSKNSLGIKVVSFLDQRDNIEKTYNLKNEINQTSKNDIKNSLFWLALIWFILLFVSMAISVIVYNRLRDYEKTIQKNNEDIVFQSRQAMLGELLPMIAHQWRQPLNKIASVLMRMRFEISKGTPNPQTLDRSSQLIEDSVDLMSQTIEDFRTFYRPREDLEEVELSVIVRKAIYFLDELLKKKKIKITHNLEMVKTTVHANELLQVLINLIKNASDAVEDNGSIDISLKDLNNGYIEIKIEDDGTGIPEDKLEKIFEAHESSKQASMGLGLYMSKLIIENRFGGSIRAYNTINGAGFVLMIPKK